MPKHLPYQAVNQSFERAVKILQDNLQYLVDQDKVSQRFISLQNAVIKALIDYQKHTEAIIESLEAELWQFSQQSLTELKALKEEKTGFEALCIIHGILDFPIWMQRGTASLVAQALADHSSKTITLPHSLLEMIEQLSPDERASLKRILF